jgi:hypothetical protein
MLTEQMIDDFFRRARTYKDDLPLFEDLGFDPFDTTSNNEMYLGEYKLPGFDRASIKVSVTCMPAMFWEFEIVVEDGRTVVLETGSGKLLDYWPVAMLIARDMIQVTDLGKLGGENGA